MLGCALSSQLLSGPCGASCNPRASAWKTTPLPAGAVEKQKLVYILNRDAAARLTISSPLEAHKSHTLVYDVVGVDVGFENPMFACLELDYEVGSNWTGQGLS